MARRGEWVYKFALPLAAIALAPTLVGAHLYSGQAASLKRQVAAERATLAHLCNLQKVTRAVWASAVTSYSSLPLKTPDQIRLLTQLKSGITEIRRDRTCTDP